ncbi:MAG: hypothetical protein HDR08_01635 [Lachnospiraceae bacterium]|nr:hypothetical protein [Lachnospiraceae bacterium]
MGRELPILFNPGRVMDILDGRKKATRRIIKFPVNTFTNERPKAQHVKVYGDTLYGETVQFYEEPFYSFYIKPPYRTGDILYVRETWAFNSCIECAWYEDESCMIDKMPTIHKDKDSESEGCYMYRADYPHPERVVWRPSIHMPKAAARIWLKVTDVRVERLQDMTLDDFLNEGVILLPEAFDYPKTEYQQAQEIFKDIWDSTIPKAKLPEYGWDANPWVWVIEFERCEKTKEEPCT